MAKRRKLPFYAISAVSGEGVEVLKFAIAEMVAEHRPVEVKIEAAPVKLKPNYPPPPSSARRRG
jgi:GTP-binding protein